MARLKRAILVRINNRVQCFGNLVAIATHTECTLRSARDCAVITIFVSVQNFQDRFRRFGASRARMVQNIIAVHRVARETVFIPCSPMQRVFAGSKNQIHQSSLLVADITVAVHLQIILLGVRKARKLALGRSGCP